MIERNILFWSLPKLKFNTFSPLTYICLSAKFWSCFQLEQLPDGTSLNFFKTPKCSVKLDICIIIHFWFISPYGPIHIPPELLNKTKYTRFKILPPGLQKLSFIPGEMSMKSSNFENLIICD